jgi:hypothetical protein
VERSPAAASSLRSFRRSENVPVCASERCAIGGIEYGHAPLTLRSDNGLMFGAKVFVNVARGYGFDQEYITPYFRRSRTG